ncbi:hypothetical protein AGRA3207_002222 [Actinomadura graeca]|uniref:Uncharacterized protein n=1 Tax=Actinomadura graeca TaxID=2750812 RepID=A0ABX8QRE0_9ACTN|nr:hypothetical protein [Actinomadura graeca]QXJ21374.1 hypothetical protein AGRA3207_002222 [Actinomadura graeca]
MKSVFRVFRRRREDELALIDAEITAFGEALAQHALVPEEHAADAGLLADYTRALDAYDQAKRAFVGDRDRADAVDVMLALAEGRHALACVDARLAGLPAPPGTPPCFFDPRHGASAERVAWTPEGGSTRIIDVCAADAVRLSEGMSPIATSRHRPPEPQRRTPARPPRPRVSERAPAPESRPDVARRTDPAPGPRREPAPFKTCPPSVRKGQQVQGRGNREPRLSHREPRVPLVLVVRLHGGARNSVEVIEDGGARSLLRARGRSRVVEPIPLSEDKHVRLRIESAGQWNAWLQPVATVPAVEDGISSRGSFVLRYAGGPAIVHMSHADKGDFSVTELDADLWQGRHVLSGTGASFAEAHLSGPTYLHVRAEGNWKIRFTPGDH